VFEQIKTAQSGQRLQRSMQQLHRDEEPGYRS